MMQKWANEAKETNDQKILVPKLGGYPVSGLGDKALIAYTKSTNPEHSAIAQAEIDRRAGVPSLKVEQNETPYTQDLFGNKNRD